MRERHNGEMREPTFCVPFICCHVTSQGIYNAWKTKKYTKRKFPLDRLPTVQALSNSKFHLLQEVFLPLVTAIPNGLAVKFQSNL